MEKLLTVKEAAELLNLKPDTVRRWAWQGRIPYVKLGGAIRFRPEDLESLVEGCKREPGALSLT